MIVGTAGHIDHGKTALVKALTGVDGDRLKEEKARGITIDLGFAYMPLESGAIVGFVDVPGHERFVHTMAAGAAGIDFALLAVAADDGVKPQTREHAAILDLMGLERGIAVITKADLAEPARIATVAAEIRAVLAPTGLRDVEILPVSALSGEGVDALRDRLVAAAAAAPVRSSAACFRLAIDRVFTLQGIGVVVTGIVLSGAVRVGDRVVISPGGTEARVRSLHAQNRAAEEGKAGERCALNLAGPDVSKDRLQRGDMALDPALHAPTQRIDARLRLLPSDGKLPAQGFPARLHHGAAEVGARVVWLRDEPPRPGDCVDVQLDLDRPIAAAQGDRFIIRDPSARRTLGGGRLLDLRPPARRRRAPEREAQRAALALDEPAAALAALSEIPPFACDLAIFARDRALPMAEIERATKSLEMVVLASGTSRTGFAAKRWTLLLSDIVERLAAFHHENPDLQGLGREKLRLELPFRLPPAIFALALQKAASTGALALEGAFARLATHSVRLSPRDEAEWAAVAPLLGGGGRFRPPRTRDIAAAKARPERDVRRLLKLAGRLGRADEVAPDHFFLRSTMGEMVAICAALAAGAEGGQFTAAEFRDQLANGRKVAIQILEFFDRHGVTVRRGELRRVDPRRLDLFGAAMLPCPAGEGGESFPVGRSDFKSGWGGETVSGGFDSHSPPPRAGRNGA